MSDDDSIPLSAVAGGAGGAAGGALAANTTGEPWVGPVLALALGLVIGGAVFVVYDRTIESGQR